MNTYIIITNHIIYADEEDRTLIVSVGIEMGGPITNELIGIVKNTGSAKIVMMG
jgi:hypothetical protein